MTGTPSTAAGAVLRVLMVDDVEDDALLAEAALRRGGYTVVTQRVDTAAALDAALIGQAWDLILCDYRMPHFSGLAALALVRQHSLDLPFILVSGTIGEEVAVAALKAGADDYVMKGNPARLVPSVQRALRDVTERREKRQAEEALRSSAARYRRLVETSADAIALLDLQGVIQMANQQTATLYHHASPRELIGQNALELLVPADRERAAAALKAVFDGAVLATHTYSAQRHDGSTFFLELQSTRIDSEGAGAVDSIMIVGRDVTARKEAEERLRFQAHLLEKVGQAIIGTDRSGLITYWNRTAETQYGWASAEVLGKSILSILPTEPFRVPKANGLTTLVGGDSLSGEFLVRHRSGRVFPILATAVPVHDEDGTVVGTIGIATDLSARVEAEDALRQSEERFRTLYEHAPIGMALLDLHGRILLVNSALQRFLGYDADALCSKSFADITYPDDVAADWILFREVLAGLRDTYTLDKRYVRKDGVVVWGHLAVSVTRDEHGAPQSIIRMILDVTERHEAELAVERAKIAAEELAQMRQERADEAMAMDAVTAALASSLEPERLYQVILEQSARILPCDHVAVTLYAQGQATCVATWGEPRLEPGSTWPTSDFWLPDARSATTYLPDADEVADWKALPPLIGPFRERSILSAPLTIDGTLVGSFDISSRTPRFYSERHRRLAAMFANRATDALRNARLFEAEHMRRRAAEDLARLHTDFVAAVSHELRTPLTAIVGFGELLLARWDQFSDERRLKRIGQIVQSANRQKRLVEDLLLLDHLEASRFQLRNVVTRVTTQVQQAAAEVQGAYPGQAIGMHGPTDLSMFADVTRVVQILVNMLDNAAKYSPDGSSVAVCWEEVGEMAVIRVKDSGPGIPVKGRELLFTRFGRVPGSRIRAGHVGTGLGLFLARQLAEAMGGDLELESTGLEGTTFRLRLPAAA